MKRREFITLLGTEIGCNAMNTTRVHHMTKLFSLILTFLATSIGSALAQSYPTRTFNIIIAFPPGGPNEGVVRFLAEKLTSSLGQAVIIENRPGGAGGTVGTRSVAN